MSKAQTLRALVNERLTAAAEDIFVLFERTIAEYEEELCRSKEETQRKQLLYRGNNQRPSWSPAPSLNKDFMDTPQMTEEPEEHSLKQEEEQLAVPVPESSAVGVKAEGFSLLQQIPTEVKVETQVDYISSEHSSDTDDDDHWEQMNWSAAQMKTGSEGHHTIHIGDKSTELSMQNMSVPESSVSTEPFPGVDKAEENKLQCPFCHKSFKITARRDLEKHIRTHTGERPFGCPICEKTFADPSAFKRHKRTHTGEKPYTCSICQKPFRDKGNLNKHMKTHFRDRLFSSSSAQIEAKVKENHTLPIKDTGPCAQLAVSDKPDKAQGKHVQCPFCQKTFKKTCKADLEKHIRVHTGEKPFQCPVCGKTFADPSAFKRHRRTHTGERPYRCLICDKCFRDKSTLNKHMKTHTGDKPYICPLCERTFTQKHHLDSHTRTHMIQNLQL